jgi:cystathionine beta-synthase
MTREITKREGIFAGNSAGSAIAGLLQLKDELKEGDVVVVIFHDHGTRYLGKMFNDEWMLEKGFFDKKGLIAKDLVNNNTNGKLITVESNDTIENAVRLMNKMNISQVPVTNGGRFIGSLNESLMYKKVISNPEIKSHMVESIMEPAFPFVDSSAPIDSLSAMITDNNPAVLVKDFKLDKTYIITRHDVINALTK